MKKPEEDVIIAKEKATWQAYKDKRADDFKKLVSPDLVAMNANGVTNFQDELETMSKKEKGNGVVSKHSSEILKRGKLKR